MVSPVLSPVRRLNCCGCARAPTAGRRARGRPLPAQSALRPVDAEAFGLDHDHILSILDVYWQARGIYDPLERQRLVGIAVDPQSSLEQYSDAPTPPTAQPVTSPSPDTPTTLPGVETVWALQTPGAESSAVTAIVQVSTRLVELASILGVRDGDSKLAGHLDVAQMLLREPRLLTADVQQVTRRLFQLRVKMPGQLDIARLLMQQPSLLLTDFEELQNASAHDLIPALSHGLPSDTASDWDNRYQQLIEYKQQQDDVHCGFRDGDESGLARWCKKQRSDYSKANLTREQIAKLHDVGFELDSEAAEWMCWYSELKRFHRENGKSADWEPFTAQHQMYLTNWCSVQRIARRSGVMPHDRIQKLDDLDFQWSGADPLS